MDLNASADTDLSRRGPGEARLVAEYIIHFNSAIERFTALLNPSISLHLLSFISFNNLPEETIGNISETQQCSIAHHQTWIHFSFNVSAKQLMPHEAIKRSYLDLAICRTLCTLSHIIIPASCPGESVAAAGQTAACTGQCRSATVGGRGRRSASPS